MSIQRMSYAQYERDLPGLRHSALKEISNSPHACRWFENHPRPDRRATELGKATHAGILEPDARERDFVVYDGTRRGKAWDAFFAEHADKTILSVGVDSYSRAIADAVRANDEARKLLEGVMPEVCVTWEEAGVLCKARLDGVSPGGIVELKTTRRPYNRPHGGFPGEVANFSYHSQLGWYWHGLDQNEHKTRPVNIICAQNAEPWEVAVYEVPGQILAEGCRRWRAWLDQYRACAGAGKWPGFATAPIVLELPEWAFERDAGVDPEWSTVGGA